MFPSVLLLGGSISVLPGLIRSCLAGSSIDTSIAGGGLQLQRLIKILIRLKEWVLRDPRHLLSPATLCFPEPLRRCVHLNFTLKSSSVSAAPEGERGKAGVAPHPRHACAAGATCAALSAAIAAATSSTTAIGGCTCEAARGQSPKHAYPMCHFLQKVTPLRVGRATSLHIPQVFSPERRRRSWMGLLRRRPRGATSAPLPP